MANMFRGILGKRVSYSDFTMVSPPAGFDSGKENAPTPVIDVCSIPLPESPKKQTTKHRKVSHGQPMEAIETNQEFDKLLDDLQIPPTLRPKLENMDPIVKASMIKSSHTLAFRGPKTPVIPPSLRRTRSIDSMDSSSSQSRSPAGPSYPSGPDRSGRSAVPMARSGSAHVPRSPSVHVRGGSVDLFATFSRAQGAPAAATMKLSKDRGSSAPSPSAICMTLSGTSSTKLDVEFVKRLRICLRNEAASWSQDFLKAGGYNALMRRLNEILEVEWREEQHDDQVLHELLRCFKALSTSAIGCFALRSSCPSPFVQLVALLYSDKKPGEVSTRHLIIELLLTLFDLYPSTLLPAIGSSGTSRRTEAWDETSRPSATSVVILPAPHKTFYSLIRAILLTPAPPPTESPSNPISPHAFIESLHKPRIYKTYLQELSDICRDYFWVFCHQNNTIWVLEDTDENKVEKPRAPGGMTGGVEFEAMGYMSTHFRFINAIAKVAADLQLPKEHDHSAYRFHQDLFLSGLERMILIGRKASTVYYPTLHLEIARYISLAGRAGYEIPWSVSRLMGPPPLSMCKTGRVPRETKSQTPRASPVKKGPRAPGPVLPSPNKMEPLRFDNVFTP
ncbi:hypothetical protein NEOLEDRAFT_1106732 [Neolentinus lepideus HHB14362 ss-1]|uniref:Formin GTPase-binding domain-containing protein n=1 Tax=Neolentinus lepideus HHB14362 ss-1 TaxID=1314782 RepID=A0A165VP62_9AGAM|nr:hypothetical protein NEOLEDRAFT_1106732 [Neolentinus lepideus HHB14362 ss-1]